MNINVEELRSSTLATYNRQSRSREIGTALNRYSHQSCDVVARNSWCPTYLQFCDHSVSLTSIRVAATLDMKTSQSISTIAHQFDCCL